MEWTTETPKIEGWYWFYDDGVMFVLEVTKIGKRMRVELGNLDNVPIANFGGHWLGPLEFPAPPKGAK